MPDYIDKARHDLFPIGGFNDQRRTDAIITHASTLEALDTERAAHEVTNAELQALREAVTILRGALHHRGGPLCSARYYSEAKCDCGVFQALEQADALTRKDA